MDTPPAPARALAIRAPLPNVPAHEGEIGQNDLFLPSMNTIHGVQLQLVPACANDSPGFVSCFSAPDGSLVHRGDDGVYVMASTGGLWIPGDAQNIKLRLVGCAHCGQAAHRCVAIFLPLKV